VPNVRRAASTLPAPNDCPTFTVAAMPKPNTAAKTRNITTLALAVAASARSPSRRPTQIALIDPLSDWRILPTSVGSENSSRVLRSGRA
jgi:hypothetical protein